MSVPTENTSIKPCPSDKALWLAVVCMVAVLTLLRFSLCGIIELLPEETYYWTYAQHPGVRLFRSSTDGGLGYHRRDNSVW